MAIQKTGAIICIFVGYIWKMTFFLMAASPTITPFLWSLSKVRTFFVVMETIFIQNILLLLFSPFILSNEAQTHSIFQNIFDIVNSLKINKIFFLHFFNIEPKFITIRTHNLVELIDFQLVYDSLIIIVEILLAFFDENVERAQLETFCDYLLFKFKYHFFELVEDL